MGWVRQKEGDVEEKDLKCCAFLVDQSNEDGGGGGGGEKNKHKRKVCKIFIRIERNFVNN